MTRMVGGALAAVIFLCQAGTVRAAVTEVDPLGVTKLMFDRAEAHGFTPFPKPPGSEGPPWGTENWSNPEQFLSWDVQVSTASLYAVSVLYLCKAGSAGSEYEIAASSSKVTAAVHETGNIWRKPGWSARKWGP